MKYLIATQEVYRVGTVEEVERLHEELKNDPAFTLGAFSYKYKCQKQKGEIIDEWQQVTVKKLFNEEKDPCTNVEVSYEVC
jgi:abortive infection bacteriophage resistance protein